MKCIEFVSTVESIIQNSITKKYPRHWHEDIITHGILENFESALTGKIIISDNFRFFALVDCIDICPLPFSTLLKIEWDIYKNNGRFENKFGDIAILVKAKYPGNKIITGTGFIEAKKRYPGKNTFNAIKSLQLEKILKNAPKAVVLLYDYEDVKFPYLYHTKAVTVPMDLVLATKCNDRWLYNVSTPFSARLFKYLLGYDLERSKEAIAIAQGYETKFGSPNFLVNVSIGVGIDDDLPPMLEVNTDKFIKIEKTKD